MRTIVPDWLTRDAKILILASSVRMFGQGFISVALAVYLATIGLSLLQIGMYFSVGGAGAALFAFAVAFISERFGRRNLLVFFTLTTALGVVGLIVTENLLILVVFAFVGALSGAPGGATGATQPLVQAGLAENGPATRRTDIFATYRIVNTFARAFGALSAGLPTVLQSNFGLGEVAAFRVLLGALVASLLLASLMYAMLSGGPSEIRSRGWTNPFTLPSRRVIFTLGGLFTVDSFGGALLIQSLVAYWFNTKFGMDIGTLSVVFFGSELLTASSLWFAAKIANRIGLLNTMVFTHIPSSLFLFVAAFAPEAWIAVIFWQLRAFFSQMDVPTRDSYIMAIVGPEERVAMASSQALGRSAATAVGPYASTLMWSAFSATAPFVACGVIKIAYDLSLWFMFRDIKPPEESRSSAAAEEWART